ncbi:MAG: hypothetical protein LBB89_06295 [Treponema sp.]|jgi:hypothetical protein|nr:hypothetical protein [Treponema sp.]
MPSFISKKRSFVLLICSWCIALSITFLLNYALDGPRLGPVYDALRGFRTPPPVSGEILLIETDEVIEPGDYFSVLMALSEMGASDLLVEVPLLGTGSGMAETGLEMSYRINDEYNLLGRNIRSLFEAIRLGLIPPAESPVYVENLVELAERGRDRLNAAIIRQDEAGSALAAQAAAVFGRAVTAVDLRDTPAGDIPWYSRPRPDRDGVLRRIAPVKHIVYHALKSRWKRSAVELSETGSVLVNHFEVQDEEMEYRFPLDRDGNILIEKQKPGKSDFRRVTLNHFRDYDQSGRTLARLLKDAEALGVYTETAPERMPLILFNYAETRKEQLLKTPEPAQRAGWIDARNEYIAALDELLNGPSEMILVNGYEMLIATERLDEKGVARLQGLRDELIRAFAALREKHREHITLRAELTNAAHASFCIMGPAFYAAGTGNTPESSAMYVSALFANALLTGRCITPGESRLILILSVVVSFIALACIHTLRPVLVLIAGTIMTLICGAGFGTHFIINTYWIDPFISMAACLGGTLFLTVSRFCIGYSRMLRFRLAYGPAVSNDMLKQMLKAGRPLLSETLCTQAAIIAVKNPGMSGREDRGTPLKTAQAAAEFQEEFSRIFKRKGALILGFENDIALACFGSPPERVCRNEMAHPAARAVNCIGEILKEPLSAQWCFGLESGECAFSWSKKTGYTANGRPMIRARLLASLAMRYQVRAVIGESAKESSDILARKLSSFAGENFYKLPNAIG